MKLNCDIFLCLLFHMFTTSKQNHQFLSFYIFFFIETQEVKERIIGPFYNCGKVRDKKT